MKSTFLAYILGFFFGYLGVHRFYTGNYVTGFIWLFTLGLFGVGYVVDFFLTAGLVRRHNLEWMLLHGQNRGNINVNVVNTVGGNTPAN